MEIFRIYFDRIAEKINRKSIESIKAWLKSNGVAFFRDKNLYYAALAEFNLAFNRDYLNHLVRNNGEERALEIFRKVVGQEIVLPSVFAKPAVKQVRKENSYQPKGKIRI